VVLVYVLGVLEWVGGHLELFVQFQQLRSRPEQVIARASAVIDIFLPDVNGPVTVLDLHTPAGRGYLAGYRPEKGRFAAAVGAGERQYLPGRQVQVYIFQNIEAVERYG
jgi:hypothetical protein